MQKQSDQIRQEPQQSGPTTSAPPSPPRRAGPDDTIILLATYIYDELGGDVAQAQTAPEKD